MNYLRGMRYLEAQYKLNMLHSGKLKNFVANNYNDLALFLFWS